MTIKRSLVSLDMRVFALCSLMKLHRSGIPVRAKEYQEKIAPTFYATKLE